MKVSRNYLKQVVKECLIEILNEGLSTTHSAPQRQQPQFSGISESPRRKEQPRRLSPLDQPAPIRYNQASQQSSAIREAVKQSSGGSSILADILSDTANTTLQSMMKNDQPGAAPVAGDAYSRVVAEHTPEDMFGEEAASKWAALAFSEPSSKKTA